MTPEEEKTLEYLEYEVENGEIIITGCKDSPTELFIPSQMKMMKTKMKMMKKIIKK